MGFLSRCHSGIVTQLTLEENIWFFLSCSGVPFQCRWDVEELVELPQECQGPFRGSGGS